jgi:mannose-6-phosphate isomerase-like protein (cupin superfamily)
MKQVSFDDSNPLGHFMSNAMREDLMPKHERKFQVFRYCSPELNSGKKRAMTRLCTTDMTIAAIRKFADGGEIVLHSHDNLDGFWMVLAGRASFLDAEGVEHEFGPLEGVMIPRETPYAFRSIGDEPLQILQVESLYPGRKNTAKIYREGLGEPPETNIDPAVPRKTTELYDARED